MYWRLRANVFCNNYNRAVFVSSLQDPIGTSVSNRPHKRGQKTPMKPTAPGRKLSSDYSVVHSRPKTPNMAKISLFNRNLRGEELSYYPNQPSGKCFWATTKRFAEKSSLKQDFFLLLHRVIGSHLSTTSTKYGYTNQ